MTHFLSPNMDLSGLVILIIAIMLGPAIILTLIGLVVLKKNKKTAKVLFILAVVYVIVSFGACGLLLVGY
jgi:hypothetical protein